MAEWYSVDDNYERGIERLADLGGVGAVLGGHQHHGDVPVAAEPPLEAADRNQQHVVLVLAEAVLALGLQGADDAAGDAVGADPGVDPPP